MTWLAYPTLALYTIDRRATSTRPKFVARRRSVHFSVAGALRDAAKWRGLGYRLFVIAGTSRAILPGAAKFR